MTEKIIRILAILIMISIVVSIANVTRSNPSNGLPVGKIVYSDSNIQVYKYNWSRYDIYLTGQIRHDYKAYRPIERLLKMAKKGQTFNFYVNNNGGSVVTLQELVHSFEITKGTINYYVTGRAISAAALLMCYADKISTPKHTVIGFHPCQGGSASQIKMCNKLFIRPLIKECVRKGILTEAEVDKIMVHTRKSDGGPWIWLTGKDIQKRLPVKHRL